MTDTPVLDPGPPPTAPSGLPSRSDRFFSWTAGLGIVRGDGWIGGVAAGIAARLRIDPLIVRGILVVVALFGFPVLFLYALAWALLPDLEDRIPLQEALRGRFSPAQVGILALLLLALVPSPVALLLGAPMWWSFAGSGGVFSVLFSLLVIALVGGLLFVIVRAAQNTGGFDSGSAPRTASATRPDMSAAAADSGTADRADAEGTDAAGFVASVPVPPPAAPAVPAADAAPDDLAAWRTQHAQWRVQQEAWRREQQNIARIARDQARRERHAHAAAFTADAAERRRIRRLTAPRTPFAFVAVALGVAVLVGTVVALTATTELAVAHGIFVGALVLALAMVVAGAARRRSGFLAFLTMLALGGGLVATAVPTLGAMHAGAYGISNIDRESYPARDPFRQPWGDLTISLADSGVDGQMYVEKRMGTTTITLEEGVELSLQATVSDSSAGIYLVDDDGDWVDLSTVSGTESTRLPDGRTRYTTTVPVPNDQPVTTRETVVLTQETGAIDIHAPAGTGADTEGEVR